MDHGNWATDIAGGSRFGYRLLWVLLMSNLMALLLQALSARLGIVSRLGLAQTCRAMFHRQVSEYVSPNSGSSRRRIVPHKTQRETSPARRPWHLKELGKVSVQ